MIATVQLVPPGRLRSSIDAFSPPTAATVVTSAIATSASPTSAGKRQPDPYAAPKLAHAASAAPGAVPGAPRQRSDNNPHPAASNVTAGASQFRARGSRQKPIGQVRTASNTAVSALPESCGGRCSR